MPDVVQGFLIFLIVQGLKGLGRVIGVDLSGAAAIIAAVVVSGIVAAWTALVASLPPEWQDFATQLMAAIAALLVASGFHYTIRSTFRPS